MIVKAMATGKNKGSVAKTHFSVLQLCLKDCDASNSPCAIENVPQDSILSERIPELLASSHLAGSMLWRGHGDGRTWCFPCCLTCFPGLWA